MKNHPEIDNRNVNTFIEGCDIWGKCKYGKDWKTHIPVGMHKEQLAFACQYLLTVYSQYIQDLDLHEKRLLKLQEKYEKNATKKITKANEKSKLKDGKQTKGLLKAKKKVSGRLS